MGCVSSKLVRKEFAQEETQCGEDGGENFSNHVVSLTSSTYGVLKLDKEENRVHQSINRKECVTEVVKKSPPRQEAEVINAWELMEGLEEEMAVVKKSPKSRVFKEAMSPLKFLNPMGSPRKGKRSGGKENKGGGNGRFSPISGSKAGNAVEVPKRTSPKLWISMRKSPNEAKCESLRADSRMASSRRRSLGPLFDPELVASLEKELSEGEEQIKKMVSATPASRKARNLRDSEAMLDLFEEKCPPGGKNAVVIYTTTLRGIRKTFEDCNAARSTIESHHVQMFERDVSMHSGYKEELRGLMGTKVVKVPLVFVKGRLIGGAEEIVKLEEEGKLGILFEGIPQAAAGCQGCGGVRFVMCMDCNGSCKLLGEDGRKSVKCGECNENGLIQCPLCC